MLAQQERVQSLLSNHAHALNDGSGGANVGHSLGLLGEVGWLGYGVPSGLGGQEGSIAEAVEAIALVSEVCLTSGFSFWCQRAVIGYLAHSDNAWLKYHILPLLLRGEMSGATGLSNAMKHLAGLEKLRIEGRIHGDSVTVNGFLPWVSNLKPYQFLLVVAAETRQGDSLVVAVPADTHGVNRGRDLKLIGLQGAWTSTINLDNVQLSSDWIISHNAQQFLATIRPQFLLLQCGLALGITRKSLLEVSYCLQQTKKSLSHRYRQKYEQLLALEETLRNLSTWEYHDLAQVCRLFQLRIDLTRLAVESVSLELEAQGGSAYIRSSSTARRLQEVAFLPVLTPSLVQLEQELHRHNLTAIG
ncbi:acyl-CoA dehydrogenase family protein [Synechocystis sp. LKSZ1]|uniref:acyl-CoA dehydrogenase family protein n=1 Tax=Synechocystis sp. LKSZ1 TaxID=3144951 RepID=UPI00336C1174